MVSYCASGRNWSAQDGAGATLRASEMHPSLIAISTNTATYRTKNATGRDRCRRLSAQLVSAEIIEAPDRPAPTGSNANIARALTGKFGR